MYGTCLHARSLKPVCRHSKWNTKNLLRTNNVNNVVAVKDEERKRKKNTQKPHTHTHTQRMTCKSTDLSLCLTPSVLYHEIAGRQMHYIDPTMNHGHVTSHHRPISTCHSLCRQYLYSSENSNFPLKMCVCTYERMCMCFFVFAFCNQRTSKPTK